MAVTHRCALRLDVLMHPPQLLTNETNLINPLIMLTLSTSIRAILSRLNRRHTLTELPRQLIQIITHIRPVVIRDLIPGLLRSLMHRINPRAQPGRD